MNTKQTLAIATALLASWQVAAAADVNVLIAWYGQTCGAAHGNVTSHVKSSCDNRAVCNYVVDARTLGDPAPNCSKNFIVLYTCQPQGPVRLGQLAAEANGRTLPLTCTDRGQPG